MCNVDRSIGGITFVAHCMIRRLPQHLKKSFFRDAVPLRYFFEDVVQGALRDFIMKRNSYSMLSATRSFCQLDMTAPLPQNYVPE